MKQMENSTLWSAVLVVALLFAAPFVMQTYSKYAEVHDFSYAALSNNLGQYPDDEVLLQLSRESMIDQKLSGIEYKEIIDHLLDKNGIVELSRVGEDHSNAKKELITMLSERGRNTAPKN